jgi:hypothetical protein
VTGGQEQKNLTDFLALSRDLTGESKLDPDLGRQYLGRFRETFGHEILKELVREHKAILTKAGSVKIKLDMIKKTIMEDEYRGAAAAQIIYLWYLSAFFMPNPLDPEVREKDEKSEAKHAADPDDEAKRGVWQYGTLEQFAKALVWTTIGAHAPMTRGGPMGHWANKPKTV